MFTCYGITAVSMQGITRAAYSTVSSTGLPYYQPLCILLDPTYEQQCWPFLHCCRFCTTSCTELPFLHNNSSSVDCAIPIECKLVALIQPHLTWQPTRCQEGSFAQRLTTCKLQAALNEQWVMCIAQYAKLCKAFCMESEHGAPINNPVSLES